MFDRDLEEFVFEDVSPSPSLYKLPLNTCNTMRHTNSYQSPYPTHFESFPEALDLSIDCHLYQQNACQIERGVIYFLKNCLVEDISKEDALLNGRLFNFPSYTQLEIETDNDLQVLISGNELLSEWNKKTLAQNFKEFHELHGLFAELKDLLGTALTQELIFITSAIFEMKLPSFRELLQKTQNSWLIPKFDRFWGDEEMEYTSSGEFKTFEELDYEEITSFGAVHVERIASQLYFSNKLRFINLRESRAEVKNNINLKDKFSSLAILLSRNLFLTIAGMSQSSADFEEF